MNKGVLKVALHHCKEITLDIDATEIISHKADAQWNTIKTKATFIASIVTSYTNWTDSQIIHWYNQRGEDSENRMKERKLDFGGDISPAVILVPMLCISQLAHSHSTCWHFCVYFYLKN